MKTMTQVHGSAVQRLKNVKTKTAGRRACVAVATPDCAKALCRGGESARRRPAKLWQLRLYVTDSTPKSLAAFTNLKKFCENHLKGRYCITVIDLLKHPQLAKGDQILAIPTVVRRLPKPVRTLIGNLSDTERVLVGLDLRPAG